jgi:hypothetical protein
LPLLLFPSLQISFDRQQGPANLRNRNPTSTALVSYYFTVSVAY